MKTSKKILIAVGGLLIVILIITVVILRNGVQSLQSKAELIHKYEPVSVESFEKLDFTSRWVVRINQGKECKVELTADENSELKPTLENKNGTLYFTMDSTLAKGNTDSIYVKIIMPKLKEIKAVQGTNIQLENFQSDSLHVILGSGCVFNGINNTLKHTSYKIAGDALLNFTDVY